MGITWDQSSFPQCWYRVYCYSESTMYWANDSSLIISSKQWLFSQGVWCNNCLNDFFCLLIGHDGLARIDSFIELQAIIDFLLGCKCLSSVPDSNFQVGQVPIYNLAAGSGTLTALLIKGNMKLSNCHSIWVWPSTSNKHMHEHGVPACF